MPRRDRPPNLDRAAVEANIRAQLQQRLDEVVTVEEAARLLHVHHRTIRGGVKKGTLAVIMPRGVQDPLRMGPGLGYRIKVSELQRWFFGE